MRAPTTALLACLIVAGCKADDGPTPTEELEDSCVSFCDRAVGCAEEFADLLEFETHDECLAGCMHYSEVVIVGNANIGGPQCLPIFLDFWSCGGATESCEVFQSFEDESFDEPKSFPHSCGDELHELLANHCTY